MIEKIKHILILGIFFCSFTSSSEDYLYPLTRNPIRSILHMDIESQIYYTDSNFFTDSESPTGAILDYLENNDRLILNSYKIALSYTPIKWVQIIPHIKSKFFYNLNSRYSVFTPTEIGVTIRSPLRTRRIGLLPSFEFIIPLDRQQELYRAIMSEETVAFNFSLYSQVHFSKNWLPFLKSAFQYRGRDLLSLFQGQAGIKYRDYVWEIGTLLGVKHPISMRNPPSQKSQLLREFNSGSLQYFVLDPFAIGTSIWAEARVNKRLHLFSILSADLHGINHSQGFALTLGFKYKFIERPKRKRSRRFRQRTQGIDTILDENDQELFREIEKIQ